MEDFTVFDKVIISMVYGKKTFPFWKTKKIVNVILLQEFYLKN